MALLLRMIKYVFNHWLRKKAVFDLSAALEMVDFTGGDVKGAMRAQTARGTPDFTGKALFS